MKKKQTILAAAALSLALALSACSASSGQAPAQSPAAATAEASKQTEAAFPRTVQGAYGDVVIPAQPKRIVTTNYEDNVLALGMTPLASHRNENDADGHFDYLGDQLKGVELIGSYQSFNFEKMISLAPDLIIGTSYDYDEQKYKDLSKVAPVLLLDFTKLSWKEVHMKIAEAMGKEAEAKKFIDEYQAKEDELKGKLVAAAGGKGILHITPNEKDFYVWGRTGKNDVGEYLYQTIGLTPAKGMPETTEQTSLEGLAKINPDILLVSESYFNNDYMNNDTWKSLKAVKSNQVYMLSKDFRIKMYYPIGVKENLMELEKIFLK